ncbi:MAG: hypothetical protein QM607_03170 [Microbacterium sp.]
MAFPLISMKAGIAGERRAVWESGSWPGRAGRSGLRGVLPVEPVEDGQRLGACRGGCGRIVDALAVATVTDMLIAAVAVLAA